MSKSIDTTQATTLDDAALDQVVGGTGSRFMLDLAGHNVGYGRDYDPPPPPPPPPPPTRP